MISNLHSNLYLFILKQIFLKFIPLSVCLSVRPPIRSFVRSFDRSFVRSVVRLFIRSIDRSLVRSQTSVWRYSIFASRVYRTLSVTTIPASVPIRDLLRYHQLCHYSAPLACTVQLPWHDGYTVQFHLML